MRRKLKSHPSFVLAVDIRRGWHSLVTLLEPVVELAHFSALRRSPVEIQRRESSVRRLSSVTYSVLSMATPSTRSEHIVNMSRDGKYGKYTAP